jgi:serine/threonine protein kinase
MIETELETETVSHATFQAPELEEVASLFPSYDVHSLIACGGMGAVYHATQRSLDRDVAIKILPREFSQDAEFRVGFEAEAKAMAKLNHPNLIGVYDFGEAGGLLFIIMEFVPGTSLYAVCHGQPVEESEAIKIVIDVCRGLANAHQFGILHRDIKPSNILLDANANPKIGDFGLASSLGNQIQEGEQIFGTPGYTPPEVIEPPHTFDHRADIFSVGVMLYELLTGNTPNGERPVSAMPRISNSRLHAIVQRATNPDPYARHASAEELATALEKIAATAPKALLSAAGSSNKITRALTTAGPRALTNTSSIPRAMTKTSLITLTSSSASPRPLTSSSPKPYVRKPPVVKKRASTGSIIVNLLLIAAIGGIGYWVVKSILIGDNEDAARIVPELPVTKAVTNKQPVDPKTQPRKTAVQEGVKPKDDVDKFFSRVEGIMKKRFKTDLDNYRQALKANVLGFDAKVRPIVSVMEPGTAAKPLADLAASMEKWKIQDYQMNDSLPESLRNISSVQQIFDTAYAAQQTYRSRLYERLNSEQATYIIGLRKQIERYQQEADLVAITLLEKEIARLDSQPDYYEFLMTK